MSTSGKGEQNFRAGT